MDILRGLNIFPDQDKVLTESQLSGFRNYKYSSIDTNPIGTYIMHPFWNWLIKYFPRWLAPNIITFTGFLFIIQSFLLLSYYDYSFYASATDFPQVAPIPRWVFAVVAYSIFISYTLDGIDGKQARRTNTSGPLGELFDHGLDSWTTVFIPVLLYSVFGRLDYSLPPHRLYYICISVFANFYLSHVEKYNTGVLYLPWSYDFSMLGSVLVFLVTFLFGQRIWKQLLFGGTCSFGRLFEIIFYTSSIVFNIPMILRCYACYQNGTFRKRNLYEGLRPLIPLTSFLVLSVIWLKYSPTNIIERDPRIFCLISGNIFSNICCQLIIAQMSNTTCEIFNTLLLPFSVVIFISLYISILELSLLYFICTFTTIYHIYYGVCIVRRMSAHFGISCFNIPFQVDSQ